MRAVTVRLVLPALVMLAAVVSGCGGDDVVVRPAPTAKERGVAPPAGGISRVDPLRARGRRRGG